MRGTVVIAAAAISALLSVDAFALTSQEIQLAIAEGAKATSEEQAPEMILLGSKSPKRTSKGTPQAGEAEPEYLVFAGSCWQAVRNWSFKRAVNGAQLDPEVARSNCLGKDFFQVRIRSNEPARPVTAIRLRIGKTMVAPVDTRTDSGELVAVFDSTPVLNAKRITIQASLDTKAIVEHEVDQSSLATIFHRPSE